MQTLLPHAEKVAALLKRRGESVAVAESSTGGLIAAALLAMPGASAYFLGGAVVYTKAARAALLDIDDAQMAGLRPSTEPYALMIAKRIREAGERARAEADQRRASQTAEKPHAKEVNGPKGPEPTRYGDWEKKGIVSDF